MLGLKGFQQEKKTEVYPQLSQELSQAGLAREVAFGDPTKPYTRPLGTCNAGNSMKIQ